jgi:hypothetical protein
VSIIIPEDFFDFTPTHINRTDEDTLNDAYHPKSGLSCSPGWRFTPATDAGKVHFLSCKRRSCPRCGKYWAWKWRKMLEDKALSLERQGLPAMRRALTLTTAYDPGYERMRIALSMFWKELRKLFPGLQYWGVTEYNQEQTQPHFHFILGNDCYIPQPKIKELWEKVQRWAGFKVVAWNVYIEEIKDNSDIQRYFTKYLTKLTGGKNEIPDREKWKGRYVRYSKKFFAWPTDVILTALFVQQNIAADTNYNSYYKVRPKLMHDWHAQDAFIEKCQSIEAQQSEFINRDWNPQRDKEIAYEQLQIVDKQLSLC